MTFPHTRANRDYTRQDAVVFGLGRSGLAAARLLAACGSRVTVVDGGHNEALVERARILSAEISGVEVILGEPAALNLPARRYTLGVVSPGIDLKVPMMERFHKANPEAPIIGEMELGYQLTEYPLVAITGTNGKTTTTELVDAGINACGLKCAVAGNIGRPLSELALERVELDVVSVEASSFQLETLECFRAAVAVWLNFAPDHLDRYRSVHEYFEAKLHIFERQKPEDFAVVNAHDLTKVGRLQARLISFNAYQDEAEYTLRGGVIMRRGQPVLDLAQVRLKGMHNAENLMAALAVLEALSLPFAQAVDVLQDYAPQRHRYEFIAAVEGVSYINDSKATNLDSLEKALSFQEKPVILIAGGKDKGFAYSSLAEIVERKVSQCVLLGEMKERIAEQWSSTGVPCHRADSMEDAVRQAHELAAPGDQVILSPGTSAFDMFSGYAERGDRFREAVLSLSQPSSSISSPAT